MATKRTAKTKKALATKTTTAKAPKIQQVPAEVGSHGRQGDVLLRVVKAMPADVEKQAGGVLRLGSATGHAHQFKEGVQLHKAKDGTVFVEVTGKHADLVHEEHGTIRFAGPAVLQYVQQREFIGEVAQPVID